MKSIAILVAFVLLSFGASAQHNETRKPQKIDSLLVVPKELKTKSGISELQTDPNPNYEVLTKIRCICMNTPTFEWRVDELLFSNIEYRMDSERLSHGALGVVQN